MLIILFLGNHILSIHAQQRMAVNADGSLPAISAALDVKSTTKGFLWPKQTSIQRALIANPAEGLLVFDTEKGQLHTYHPTQLWKGFINSTYWLGFTGVVYNSIGNVGIGTSVPIEKLHVANGNVKVTNGAIGLTTASSATQYITFNYSGGSPNDFAQGIDFTTNSIGRNAYINYIESNSDANKQVRIFPSVSGQHLFTMFGSGEFRFSAIAGPTIQLQNNGVNKGFLQVSGNDLRLGTNSGNSSGKIVIRTGGADRVVFTNTGRVGIGTTTPEQALHVLGNISNTGNVEVEAVTSVTALDFSGKLTKPSVSNAALTPLCYGSVNADGTEKSVTINADVTKVSTGRYDITCAGLDATCMILVTAGTSRCLVRSFHNGVNKVTIDITYDNSTRPPSSRDSDFCFLIYKP